ncbi:MAG: hypothetical protein M3O31_03120 [Acidobacteriota bacterium]|nr:hypothetical protein [Acidobacteriota bacterium]
MNVKRHQARLLSLAVAWVGLLCSAATAQPKAGSDWTKVQAIQSGTLVRISSQHRPTICSFVAADEDSLTCTKTQTFFFVPVTHRLVYRKQEVTLVKLSRQFLSGLAGTGIGAGAGAGIGAGVESQYSGRDDPHLLTVVFAILGGAIGSGVGAGTDFLAGPTVYRAP